MTHVGATLTCGAADATAIKFNTTAFALDAAGKATGSCADIDVSQGTKPYNRFAYEERPAQTFPCLGATRPAQQWNLGPDGRLVNRQFPAACLGITKKTNPEM